MASSGSDTKMSEETFDFVCTSCFKDNTIKEAVKYCVECKGYCCEFCVNMHKKFPQLNEHNLLDTSTPQQADQTSKVPSFPTERCSIHHGKVIDMYCGDHDVVGCYVCITIDHKNCTNIHSIPDDIELLSKDKDMDKYMEDLHTTTERLTLTLQKSNEMYQQKLDDAKQNCLLAITEQRREADAILNRLENEARDQVQSEYSKLKSQLVNSNQRTEMALNKLVDFGDKIKRANGNQSQKFVCTKLSSSTIRQDQDDIVQVEQELSKYSKDDFLTFVPDASFLALLNKFSQFGNISYAKTKNEAEKNTPYKVKRSQDLDVKLQDDTKTCDVWGCCILDDNNVLITDRDNTKLKRVNIDKLMVEDYIVLPYDLIGICCVKYDEVAVACYKDKIIQFVSVGQTMTPSRQMKLNHRCFHVAYMDNKLYVTDDLGGSVYIYDMVGALLQKVKKSTTSDEQFLNTVQITGDNGDNVFVSIFREGLVHLGKKGNLISIFEDPEIKAADGVCIDNRGNIFVAGRESNNVVQLGYDGKRRGVIVNEKDGIKSPLSVCFHPKSSKLIITMNNNNKVKVLDVE